MRVIEPIHRGALAAVLLLATVSAGHAQGTPAEPTAAQAAQRERMTQCNAEAGKRSLDAEARRPFMRDCLAGRMPPAPAGTATPAQAAQRERMTQCNAEAGTRSLAAEARRDFMRDCLAGRRG